MVDMRGIDKLGQLKFKHLWVMSINFGATEGEAVDAYLVKTSARPHITNDEVTVSYLNLERGYKGKSHWSTISVELIDPIQNSAAAKVWKWILKHHDPVTGYEGYKDMYAVPEVSLKLLSPIGTTVEEWIMHNVWITDSDFQGLDYSTAEPVGVSLTLKYDWAELVSTVE